MAVQATKEGIVDLSGVMLRYYSEEVEKGPEKTHRVSPSRILKCQRGAVMESLGYSEPPSVQTDQNFEYGTIRHKAIQKAFVKDGKMLTPEGEIYPKDKVYEEEEITFDDPPLLAYMDGRIRTPLGHAVLEIKTTTEKPNSIKAPMYTHADQAQLYMHLMGIPIAYLFYESKKTKQGEIPWVQFFLEYDKDRAEYLIKKGKNLLKNLQNRYLPMKDENCYSCKNPACFDNDLQRREGLKGWIL